MDELLKKRVVGRCFCCLASNHLSLIVATMFGASTALSLGIVLATVDPPPPRLTPPPPLLPQVAAHYIHPPAT
jgi:hypothetical protein